MKKKPNGYWTYEKCKDVALMCETKIDLKKTYNAAYNKINKNNWFELTDHIINIIKPKGYWTYEKCKNVALECENKIDFVKKYSTANDTINKNDWIELTSHFIESQKPNGYWTYDKCKDSALKCKNNKELKEKYRTAYKKITQNNWIELTSHFIKTQKPKNYWTYEKCKEVALDCETKTELKSKYSSIYNKICKEKWFDLLSHLRKVGNRYKRLIYSYEFCDNHCYVGLTGNIKRRNNQHLLGKDKSSVKKYISKTKLTPILIIKSDYIDVNLAILLEEEILNDYKKNGWIVLNEVKTGGIGSHDLKWTKESCENEVKKYNNLNSFIKNSGGMYVTIIKKGWNEILLPIKTRHDFNFWNDKEKCRIESKKYRNVTEFASKCWGAYNCSKVNNWIDDFFNIKSKVINGYWNNKEKCRIESTKYNNRTNFCKKSHSAYMYSIKNNWIDDFFN